MIVKGILLLLAYLLIGFFGTGLLWRLVFSKVNGKLDGFGLFIGTILWPFGWPIALGVGAFAYLSNQIRPWMQAYLKWTGGEEPTKKDISAC